MLFGKVEFAVIRDNSNIKGGGGHHDFCVKVYFEIAVGQ